MTSTIKPCFQVSRIAEIRTFFGRCNLQSTHGQEITYYKDQKDTKKLFSLPANSLKVDIMYQNSISTITQQGHKISNLPFSYN